jgi:hypothetical protein
MNTTKNRRGVIIPNETLIQILSSQCAAVPEGSTLINAETNHETGALLLVIHHPSFEPVKYGARSERHRIHV